MRELDESRSEKFHCKQNQQPGNQTKQRTYTSFIDVYLQINQTRSWSIQLQRWNLTIGNSKMTSASFNYKMKLHGTWPHRLRSYRGPIIHVNDETTCPDKRGIPVIFKVLFCFAACNLSFIDFWWHLCVILVLVHIFLVADRQFYVAFSPFGPLKKHWNTIAVNLLRATWPVAYTHQLYSP